MQTTTTKNLTPGTDLLHDLTGEVVATIASIEQVSARSFRLTYTNGTVTPPVNSTMKWRTA